MGGGLAVDNGENNLQNSEKESENNESDLSSYRKYEINDNTYRESSMNISSNEQRSFICKIRYDQEKSKLK